MNPSTSLAQAAIDESDTFGIRALGVPLRATPTITGEQVDLAFHGDLFAASCWTVGDPVSNGVYFNRSGAYESHIWFRITTWAGDAAFVPDTRFSRTGRSDRMALPRCASSA